MASNGNNMYTLPRDADESARLDSQHHIWVSNVGFLLHPTITSSLPDKATVADVATGTGIWLTDLARSTKSYGKNHQYFGLDLSAAQFPRKSPNNVEFDELDILRPVPEEWRDRFDAIHVRLLVCALGSDDWGKAMENLLVMLRPGGWLQWEELDFNQLVGVQNAPGVDAEALTRFCRTTQGVAETVDRFGLEATVLHKLFEGSLEEVRRDVFASDRVADTRVGFTQALLAAGEKVIKIASDAQEGRVKGYELEYVDEVTDKAGSAAEGGKAYLRGDMIVTIGRKPSVDADAE